ncbi:MAG: DNA polymerase III subunit gamma/tau [Paracoccaceae bacterium]
MNDTTAPSYRVLARKYRPETFADVIGQDALVRTLKNAFEADRIAHAFIMTGIRGTGKTTTARIIAKGLNCIGPDGTGKPTISPCGQCEPCLAIAEGRHVDVIEMDAASNTGVQNIRDAIIEGVAYRAASARYKVFIIDEVHMLSTSAFNALLKTLEEPPAHVKFIFATTEIRKVPVTVLSRCQRFDLRRIEPEDMLALLRKIAKSEGAEIAEDALALITRAAEGSARDATSLLDQAISHGAGTTTVAQVRAMLGLADRGRVLDLFDLIVKGDAAGALGELAGQYADGAEPMAVLRDLAEITHWVSVLKITPEAVNDPTIGADERDRGQIMAQALHMRVLTRMWQMLLKALEEVASAPNSMMAAEMAIIRMTHVADLPSPEELVRRLADTPTPPNPPPGGGGSGGGGGGAPRGAFNGANPSIVADIAHAPDPLARYAQFEDVITLIRTRRDMQLLVEVETYLRLVHYAPGRIEFSQSGDARADLAQRLSQRLQSWTGARWGVSVVAEKGADAAPTIAETRALAKADLSAQISGHPLVAAALAAFPGAEMRPPSIDIPLEDQGEGEDMTPENWDPFEED